MDSMQPGQVVSPRSHGGSEPVNEGGPAPERPLPQPSSDPVPTPAPAPAPESMVAAQPADDAASQSPQDAGWQFHQEHQDAASADRPALADISWTASEFVNHEKSTGWYALLAAGGVVVAAIVYLLTKDVLSTAVVLFAVIVFGVFAARKPHVQEYALTRHGLQIGTKTYSFHDFKNFSVDQDGALASVVFMPLKRFMPPLTIYVAPDMEDKVFEFLSAILPFEQHRADAVDSLLRRIRF